MWTTRHASLRAPGRPFCTCLTRCQRLGDTIFRGQPMFPISACEVRSPHERLHLGAYTFREVGSMKSLRLLALVPLACACTASAVLACDAHKTAKATTAGSTTTTTAV